MKEHNVNETRAFSFHIAEKVRAAMHAENRQMEPVRNAEAYDAYSIALKIAKHNANHHSAIEAYSPR